MDTSLPLDEPRPPSSRSTIVASQTDAAPARSSACATQAPGSVVSRAAGRDGVVGESVGAQAGRVA